jgi:hypothetical protein
MSGTFLAPTVVVGHGAAITLALQVLLSPMRKGHWEVSELSFALVPMLVVWLIVYAAGFAAMTVANFRARSRRTPSPQVCRRERSIVLSAYAGFAVLVVAAISYRVYAREFLASYGPFVVTIDTGSHPLRDIVTHLNCGFEYTEKAVLESGKPHEFPRRYAPDLIAPLACSVTLIHPALQPYSREYSLADLAPHTRITLPTVHPAPWSDAKYQRIIRGEEIPPGSEGVPPLRRAEIAVYDDWGSLATQWVPSFCTTDIARIEREYLGSLADRRTQLFLSNGATPPADDPAAIVREGWRSTCDSYASRPQH